MVPAGQTGGRCSSTRQSQPKEKLSREFNLQVDRKRFLARDSAIFKQTISRCAAFQAGVTQYKIVNSAAATPSSDVETEVW